MFASTDAALAKMLIEAFETPERSGQPAASFTVMFNPTSYGYKHEVTYETAQALGDASSPQNFENVQPQEHAFELTFDGTGTAVDAVDVYETVESFLDITGRLQGDLHRPYYLKVSWGTFLSHCVLKSAEVTYTLFAPDGTPLRAKVAATFAESVDDAKRVAQERKSSPDLTHERTVHEGDHLSLMADRIYRDPARYLQVAKANRLKHFRRLRHGQDIVFPPVQDVPPDAPLVS